jgi:hypothetical protein
MSLVLIEALPPRREMTAKAPATPRRRQQDKRDRELEVRELVERGVLAPEMPLGVSGALAVEFRRARAALRAGARSLVLIEADYCRAEK